MELLWYVNYCLNCDSSKHGALTQCSYNVTYDGRVNMTIPITSKHWPDVVTVYNMRGMSATQKCTLRTVVHHKH